MIKNLASLINVKSLLTLGTAGMFIYLAVTGQVENKDVMLIVALIFQSYFSYQNNKKGE